METGTEILIARMKTNPEEFVEGMHSKWAHVMQLANDCLPDEDKAALKQTYTQAKIERFNGEVLATLVGEREQLGVVAESSLKYKVGSSDPRAMYTNQLQGALQEISLQNASSQGFFGWFGKKK